MFRGTFRIGRWAGVPITVNWIVLAVAGLLTLSLGTTVMPSALGEVSTIGVWALAGGGTALLVASLVEAPDESGGRRPPGHGLGRGAAAVRSSR